MPDQMLAQHGTQLMALKPQNVIQAALADLKKRERNIDKKTRGYYERYAFHRKHVRKAETAQQLIRAALDDRAIGEASTKINTRLIYCDEELLKRAIELLGGTVAENQ